MFEKLLLKNFQKYKNKEIDFAQITTITGPTDAGKSTILRALRWVCTNDGRVSDFIRTGASGSRVTLWCGGRRVSRVRGKSNSYSIDGKSLRAFGSGTPDAVSELLRTTALNFQSQLDGPFWFGLSPGIVSKELNKIVDLEVIDTTLANLSTEVRKSKTEVEVLRKLRKEAIAEKKKLKWIEKAAKQLKAIERLHSEATAEAHSVDQLSGLIESILTARRDCSNASNRLAAARKVLKAAEPAVKRLRMARNLSNQIQEIQYQIKNIDDIEYRLTKAKQQLSNIKRCPICQSPLT